MIIAIMKSRANVVIGSKWNRIQTHVFVNQKPVMLMFKYNLEYDIQFQLNAVGKIFY